ncbi:hypothetical protein H4R18_005829 [Coemansia javaensis]|uniref:Dynein light intermediate chain n=1 Tax=Coemansia javaensis TaxID=2761396 RepID=A0A9W8LE91_9FUNG|nr:hypothetical protein H4R18_005829 [Coemansia javaensis]
MEAIDGAGSLWEAVLREVGSARAVASKRVVVLGDSGSGKSSVVAQLLAAAARPQAGNGAGALGEPFGEAEPAAALARHDLALSYAYIDVHDEDNEETLARLGVYQLASDRAADRELLRLALDAQAFADAAAVVVLDWSRPWRFVKSLLRWIDVLSRAVDAVCGGGGGGWTPGRAAVDECRERLERFLQEYVDPAAAPAGDAAAAAAAAVAKAADVLLPLGAGVLEANLGLPLVVVCTKADAMAAMERERGFKEEDFDHVQQVLRAVCLRFGAALIYTSTHNPATFATLYHYLVHRLLTAPATLAQPSAGPAADDDGDPLAAAAAAAAAADAQPAAAAAAAAPAKPPPAYPFRVGANVVDRDLVFVPAGWDSAAKIGYLREPFDVAAIQAAWRLDEARYQAVVERAMAADAQPQWQQPEALPADVGSSLLLMFGEAVPAPGRRAGMDAEAGSAAAAAAAAAATMASHVAAEDDQAFLERLFEEQQAQIALEGDEAGGAPDAAGDGHARRAGPTSRLVSSLLRSVHTAESSLSTASAVDAGALSDDAGAAAADDDGARDTPSPGPRRAQPHHHRRTDSGEFSPAGSVGRAAAARLSRQPSSAAAAPAAPDPAATVAALRRKLAASAANASTSSAAGAGAGANANASGLGDAAAPASTEELTSFYQNLLGRKGGVASSSNASSSGRDSPQQPARSLSGSLSRATGAAKKDIQADLERWKAQLRQQKE